MLGVPPTIPPLPPNPPPGAPASPPAPVEVTFPDGHLTVDVLGHASSWTWLAPVLAFIGTLILFGAAMITLWRSNKAANTRSAADQAETRDRDFRLWQRDNMLRVSSDIVECAIEAENEYTMLAHSPNPIDTSAIDAIDRLERKVASSAASLRIAGARDAGQQCVDLRNAMNSRALVSSVSAFNIVYRAQRDAIGSAEGAANSDEFQRRIAILRMPLDMHMAPLYIARYRFEKIVENELRTLNLPRVDRAEIGEGGSRSERAPGVSESSPEVDDRVEYILLALTVDEHDGSTPTLSVGSLGIEALVHRSFPAAFPLYVVGRLKPGHQGTVTATLSPLAEMGGTESAETREWPPIFSQEMSAPMPPPTFVVGLNPFVMTPGMHRVLVNLNGQQIADMPLDLRVAADISRDYRRGRQ